MRRETPPWSNRDRFQQFWAATDKVVDAPMDMRTQIPIIQSAQKTVEVSHVQSLDKMVDIAVVTQGHMEIPVVMQRQGSNIQAVQQTADAPHEDVPASQHRPPSIQRVQKSVEVARVIPHERLLRK